MPWEYPASTASEVAALIGTDGTPSAANPFVTDSDARNSDARTPTAHTSSHTSGGSDPIALDTLAAPTDIVTLNASTSAHGLLKKLDNVSTNFMNGQGNWAAAGAGAAAWGSVTGTLGDQTDLQTELDAKQPLDTDLTTIAGLTATTNNFIVSAASAWASRTPAQAKTSLALVKGDVGLGSVDNTTDAGKPVSTATQTALDLKANLLGADDNYATDAEKVKLSNLSNTNTGDQTSIVGITGTTAQFNTALSDANFATGGGTATGANTGDQTTIVGITGTIAQFNTAISDGDLATGGGTATGTNTGDQTLPTDATIATTDVTTNNVTTSKHGWFPKLPSATGLFLKDDLTWAAPGGVSDGDKTDITVSASGATWTIDAAVVTEAKQLLADNTTQDVSITKHGYVPKAPNISTQFLRGDATWAVPAGGAGGASLGLIVATGMGMNLS